MLKSSGWNKLFGIFNDERIVGNLFLVFVNGLIFVIIKNSLHDCDAL